MWRACAQGYNLRSIYFHPNKDRGTQKCPNTSFYRRPSTVCQSKSKLTRDFHHH